MDVSGLDPARSPAELAGAAAHEEEHQQLIVQMLQLQQRLELRTQPQVDHEWRAPEIGEMQRLLRLDQATARARDL